MNLYSKGKSMKVIIKKPCLKCGLIRPLFDFPKNIGMKDGFLNGCKKCASKYKKKYRRTNAGKATQARASKRYREKYPNAAKASMICGNAITWGKLLKVANCESCGDPSNEAHHDDYNYPLQVRWLCITCHKKWHKHNTPKNRK